MNEAVAFRLRYLPFQDARPGMVLGNHLTVPDHGVVRLCLPEGHILTPENMAQLASLHAEYVCVAEPDERSPEVRQFEWQQTENALVNIFGISENQNTETAQLFAAMLAYQRAK